MCWNVAIKCQQWMSNDTIAFNHIDRITAIISCKCMRLAALLYQ